MANEVNGKFWAVDSAGNLYIVNPVTLKSNIEDLSVASQLENGLMSIADKKKLDGITESADAVSISRSVTSGTKIGTVTINGTDVDLYVPTADAAGAAATALSNAKSHTSSAVSTHNTSTSAHSDIRDLISELTTRMNTLADSDDTTLDQMSEIVTYIKANKSLIDSITTSKVNVSDIVNNLTTNVSTKPLSAAQGVTIKALIDALQTEVNGKAASSHTHSLSSFGITATATELNKLDGVTATATELNYVDGVTSNIQTQINGKADKNSGFFYIVGTGDTAGTWLGSSDEITEYFDGLTILYKVAVAGLSGSTTLNINDLGAVTVVRNASTAISTEFPVNAVVLLTYTTDSGTAYWKVADYDSNTKTTTSTTNKTGTKLFLAGATSQGSGKTTYSNSGCYVGTDNCLYSNSSKVAIDSDVTTLEEKIATLEEKLAYFVGVDDAGVYISD